MIVKFHSNGVNKKVSLRENLRQLAAFKEIAARFISVPAEQVTLSFVDSESETIRIVDEVDFEYFLENLAQKKTLTVEVDKLEQATKPAPVNQSQEFSVDVSEVEVSKPAPEQTLSEVKETPKEEKKEEIKEQPKEEVKPTPSEFVIKEEKPEVSTETQPTPVAEVSKTEVQPTPIVEIPKTETNPVESNCAPKCSRSPLSHRGIYCDGCKQTLRTGRRFKCLVCNDFDLCEACEAKGHPHIMLKINETTENHVYNMLRNVYLANGSQKPEQPARGPRRFPPFGHCPFRNGPQRQEQPRRETASTPNLEQFIGDLMNMFKRN